MTAEERAKNYEWSAMLIHVNNIFETRLIPPLKNTHANDVPVIATEIVLTAIREAEDVKYKRGWEDAREKATKIAEDDHIYGSCARKIRDMQPEDG